MHNAILMSVEYLFFIASFILEMPRKCSVGNCSSNYSSNSEKVKVFMFPRDEDDRNKWISALPNIIKEVTENMGIYETYQPFRSRHKVNQLLLLLNYL